MSTNVTTTGDYGIIDITWTPGESEQAALIVIQVLFVTISLTSCCLRVISRNLTVFSLGADDYIMILATFLSLCLAINICIGTRFGWGKHVTDVSHEQYMNALIVSWISEILFTLTVSAVRISICIFYIRLAVTRTYKVLTYCTIGYLTLWCICFVFVTIFQCHPVSAYWHPTFQGTQNPLCLSATIPFGVHGVTNILNDLFVYFLPMPMLLKLQLPRRQKIGVIMLFGVGAFVCIAEALRLYYSIAVNESNDITWGGFQLFTWEAATIDLGIACTCAPAMKPLAIRYFPSWLTSVFGRTTNLEPSEVHLEMNSANAKPPGGKAQMQPKQSHVYKAWEDEERAERSTIGYPKINKDASSEESLTRIR